MTLVSPRIVVGVDGSPRSGVAASVGADLARRFGAELHLVAVVEDAFAETYRPDERARLLDGEKRAIEASHRIPVEVHVAIGDPVNQLRNYVAAYSAGLLVVGTSHHTRITIALLGSVVDDLVGQVLCPILVVRNAMNAWPPSHVVTGDDNSIQAGHVKELAAAIAETYGVDAINVMISEGVAEVEIETGHRTLIGITAGMLAGFSSDGRHSRNETLLHRGNGPLLVMPTRAVNFLTRESGATALAGETR